MRTQSWDPTDRVAASSTSQLDVYSTPGGTGSIGPITDKLTLSKPGTSGLLLYSYVGGGLWERREATTTFSTLVRANNTMDAFVYGFPTADAAVPRTGTASYGFDLYARADLFNDEFRGMGTLDANFATSGLSLTGSGGLGLSGGLSGRYFSISGTGTIASTNNFSGSILLNVTGGSLADRFKGHYNGTFEGSFFGPNADELGASFNMIKGDIPVAGWFLGRRADITSTSLQELTSLRFLNGVSAYQNWDVITAGDSSLPTGSVQNGFGEAGTGAAPHAFPAGGAYVVNSIQFVETDKIASDSRFDTFQVTQGGRTYTLRAYRPGTGNDQLVLSYVSLLDWQRSFSEPGACTGCTAIDNLGYSIVYGMRTDPTTLPRSGSATYTGLIFGRGAADGIARYYSMTGTANFVANFATDQLTGTLMPTLTNTATGNSFTIGALVLGAGGIARVGPIDSGTAALIAGNISGAGTGNYSAAFYGPAAQELGAAFTARGIINPEAAGSPITISGAALTKRQ